VKKAVPKGEMGPGGRGGFGGRGGRGDFGAPRGRGGRGAGRGRFGGNIATVSVFRRPIKDRQTKPNVECLWNKELISSYCNRKI